MDEAKYDSRLEQFQAQTFNYFYNETNTLNGLVIDRTAPDWPASIAATGLALTSYPIAVERGFITRENAANRVLTTLRFLANCRKGSEPEASGYHGFYYHFLDMNSGRRARQSELSIMDTSILLAGALTAACYFDNNNSAESEIRELAYGLYLKADWQWAFGDGPTIAHGWKPETGFLSHRWKGYDEAMLIHILGLGSPTFPLPQESYSNWTSTFEWIDSYDYEYLYAGPLFVHEISHIWIDFRGIQDFYMRNRGIDYFENSSRATHVQQLYAIDNPGNFNCYGKYCWGISRSNGPGPAMIDVKGEQRQFFGFTERGVPYGPDDGTISPWAAIASIPFAPEIVLPTIDHFLNETDLNAFNLYGFKSSFNPTYPHKTYNPHGWKSPWYYGITQGPVISLIENYRTGFLWQLMKNNEYIVNGLKKAGFTGGWLKEKKSRRETARRLDQVRK